MISEDRPWVFGSDVAYRENRKGRRSEKGELGFISYDGWGSRLWATSKNLFIFRWGFLGLFIVNLWGLVGFIVLFCNEEIVLCAVVWISIPKSLCVISFPFDREMVLPGKMLCLVGRSLIIARTVLEEPRQCGSPDPSLSLTFLGFHDVSSSSLPHYPVPSPICCLINQKQRDHLTKDWNHETMSPN